MNEFAADLEQLDKFVLREMERRRRRNNGDISLSQMSSAGKDGVTQIVDVESDSDDEDELWETTDAVRDEDADADADAEDLDDYIEEDEGDDDHHYHSDNEDYEDIDGDIVLVSDDEDEDEDENENENDEKEQEEKERNVPTRKRKTMEDTPTPQPQQRSPMKIDNRSTNSNSSSSLSDADIIPCSRFIRTMKNAPNGKGDYSKLEAAEKWATWMHHTIRCWDHMERLLKEKRIPPEMATKFSCFSNPSEFLKVFRTLDIDQKSKAIIGNGFKAYLNTRNQKLVVAKAYAKFKENVPSCDTTILDAVSNTVLLKQQVITKTIKQELRKLEKRDPVCVLTGKKTYLRLLTVGADKQNFVVTSSCALLCNALSALMNVEQFINAVVSSKSKIPVKTKITSMSEYIHTACKICMDNFAT